MNIPEKLGKYEVIECVGRGSMGIVYAGHDPYADRKVAIKVCSISDENESQSSRLAKKLFFNEAHTTGSLDHPNILSVLDAGEDGDQPYMDKWWVPGLCIGYEHSFVHQVADFLDNLAKGQPCGPTFRDALDTQKVCDAVLASANSRQWAEV